MLTFRLLPSCRLRDGQKCHCVMANNASIPSTVHYLLSKISEKIYLHFKNWGWRNSGACEELPVSRFEMWHRATTKSQSLKGSISLFSLSLSYTHIHTQAQQPLVVWAACTHQILRPPHPCNLSLGEYITELTDSAGAKLLPSAVEVCSFCVILICAPSATIGSSYILPHCRSHTSKGEKQFPFQHLYCNTRGSCQIQWYVSMY